MAVSKIVQTIKSITAREVFKNYPKVKRKLWGGNFWTSGFYANTVGQYGNKDVIKNMLRIKDENINQYTQNNSSCGS